ncbi:MAG: polysaccharide deacetylase family protein, partial [Chitinispirillia bacterium]
NFYTTVFPLLEKYRIKASVFPVVNCINDYYLWDIYKPKKHLSQIQIQEISDAGHEIGSHTLSHPDLTFLSDKDIIHELLESKKNLEDLTGKPVLTISFPFGSWNSRIWSIASDLGYEVGIVYRNRIYNSSSFISPTGIYAFDSINDIVEKIERANLLSPVHSRDIIMPHFARGTSVWKYRKSYNILNYFKQ